MGIALNEEQKRQLESIAKNGNPSWIRRARVVLLDERDLPADEIGQEVGLSPDRVGYWIREFNKRGMDIFPAEALPVKWEHVDLGVEPSESEKGETAAQASVPPPLPGYQDLPEISVGDLCEMHQVDMMHARQVADYSLALFDQTSTVHQLGEESRSLLETAAIVHNIGLVAHPAKHNSFGRDILLSYRLIGFDELETRTLAFTTALHRKKYRQKRAIKEAEVAALPEEQLDRALRLAALVRIADGLDYSQSQTTTLGEMSQSESEIVFSLSGPFAYEDGMRAQNKADLWDSLFEVSVQFSVESDQDIEAIESQPIRIVTAPTERPKVPGIQAEDWMSEAGRKTLQFHYFRMLDHEAGTRLGEDIEELHDMRVAVRRMRSAMWVFGPYFKKGILKSYLNGLRQTGRALGRVRDLDVFMDKAQEYVAEKSVDDGTELEPLIEAWQSDRDAARERMLKHLDSKRYRSFVQSFGEFLDTEGAGGKRPERGEPAALKVFQCAPAMIYERDRVVRGYNDALQEASLETLHSLRIDIKRFRYTLEFFREVLADDAKSVIRSAVQLQDHLGDLNDADVACQLLIEFLDRWRVEDKREQVNISGITQYLVAKQVELRELVNSFPEIWESYASPDLRRELALAVANL